MNPERFDVRSVAQLVMLVKEGTPYWAFVPRSLPPALPLDPELIQALTTAYHALGALAGLAHVLPDAPLLGSHLARREAIMSLRMSGIEAELVELYASEAGLASLPHTDSPARQSVYAALNYVRTLEYGLERFSTLPASLQLLRELHQRLLAGLGAEEARPGEFRQVQSWIGKPGCSLEEATLVPPAVPEMRETLNALQKYFYRHDGYSHLARVAFIHYQLGAIHPFMDGNGRMARLTLLLLMAHYGLLPLPLLTLSAYFWRNKKEYDSMLMGVTERGAWKEWLLFFLQGVQEQASDCLSRGVRLGRLRAAWREQLQQARVHSMITDIADTLLERPIPSVEELMQRFNISHLIASQALRHLQEMGILEEVTTRENDRLYRAAAVFRILEEEEEV